MGDRFKELRKALSLTQQKFADELYLSRIFVAQIEMGLKTPSERTIKDICRKFKVNYDWLVYGTGNMFQDDNSDAQAIINSILDGDDEFIKSTLIKFAKLDAKYWQMIKDILEETMRKSL